MNKRAYFFCLTLFLLIDCNKDLSKDPDDFTTNLRKWESYQISSYSMTLSVACFCIESAPIKIEVEDYIIKKIDDVQINSEQLLNDYWFAKTIDELFVFIKEKLSKEPFQKVLEFNQVYGYPENLYFDMDEMIADEEIGYTISSFKFKID